MSGLSAVLLAALISPAAPAEPPVDLTVAPDLSGTWEGKGWGTVTLRRTDGGYEGTYTDTYGKDTGRISLRWSRRSGGFEGAWSEGKYRFGRLSVRAEGGGKPFAFGSDTGPATAPVVVKPDQGGDTVDPPLEYKLDVTDAVRGWLSGAAPNHGLAIAPVIDKATDEGQHTRFQVYASEHSQVRFTPRLAVQVQP